MQSLIKKCWNEISDEYNQWDNISTDERLVLGNFAKKIIDKSQSQWNPASNPPENDRFVMFVLKDGEEYLHCIGFYLNGRWHPSGNAVLWKELPPVLSDL